MDKGAYENPVASLAEAREARDGTTGNVVKLSDFSVQHRTPADLLGELTVVADHISAITVVVHWKNEQYQFAMTPMALNDLSFAKLVYKMHVRELILKNAGDKIIGLGDDES